MLNIPIFKNAILKKAVLNSNRFWKSPVQNYSRDLKYINNDVLDSLELVGKGAEGSVYKVKGSQFAIKVKNDLSISKELNKPIDLTVDPQGRINHVLAKVGENVSIMKFIDWKPIDINALKELNVDKIKPCMKHICDAVNKGFRHDFGGKNILLDKASGKLVPIDFIPKKIGYKEDLLSNMFIQLYTPAKNSDDVNKLMANISLAFVQLLKENAITTTGLKNLSINLKTVKDIIRMNRNFAESELFITSVEKKLQDVVSKKLTSGFSKECNSDYLSSLERLKCDLEKYV